MNFIQYAVVPVDKSVYRKLLLIMSRK